MGSEMRAQIISSICALWPEKGHRAQIGHRSKKSICALLNYCSYYLFFLKGTEGTDKKGGISNMSKNTQNKGFRDMGIRIREIANNLCPVPSAGEVGVQA